MTVSRLSRWQNLGERLAQLQDGESIILESEGDLAEEARKISHGLSNVRICSLVRRRVRVVEGKIVITRVGTWRPWSR
jgi:hypothetical protein